MVVGINMMFVNVVVLLYQQVTFCSLDTLSSYTALSQERVMRSPQHLQLTMTQVRILIKLCVLYGRADFLRMPFEFVVSSRKLVHG